MKRALDEVRGLFTNGRNKKKKNHKIIKCMIFISYKIHADLRRREDPRRFQKG
jgi:hypothetical protein